MKKKATLSDVARLANVSISTVSRIATGTARVNSELERRVRNAAAELGIGLSRQNRSRVIAFLLSNRDKLHPFHSRVLLGSEDYCAQHGYDLVFCSFRYSLTASWRELRLPRISERRQSLDGFIIGGTNSHALLELLTRKRFPFAVLGNNVVGTWQQQDYDVVWSDDIHGAYEMTRYLQSLGHRKIAYIGNIRLPWFSRCNNGYTRAMLEASLQPRTGDFNAGNAQELGYLATKFILRSGDPVSAILAGDAPVASGAYQALRDSELEVPENVSVAAVGESGSETLDPPLTTVREFPEQVGSEMARLVLSRVTQPDAAHQQIVVPTQLIKRESCSRISFVGTYPANIDTRGRSLDGD